jgi:hypothetical protein
MKTKKGTAWCCKGHFLSEVFTYALGTRFLPVWREANICADYDTMLEEVPNGDV